MSEQQRPAGELSQQLDAMQQQSIAMQETILHLQRDVEHLHEALLAQTADIEALRAKQNKLDGQLEQLQSDEEFPKATEETPPHY